MFAILPLAVGARVDDQYVLGHEIVNAANEFGAPYQIADANFGWSARDACYSYGSSCSTRVRHWSSPTGRRNAGSGTWWSGISSWRHTAPTTPDAR